MKRRVVELYSPGIRAVLNSTELSDELGLIADQIAEVARGHESIQRHGADITVEEWTTDRAVFQVAIEHPAGLGIEGKYAVLMRAAQGMGMDVDESAELIEYVTKSGKKRMATRAQVDNWTRGSRT